MIPKVKTWKVRDASTGKTVFIDTINKDFARWFAVTNHGMYGCDLKISVSK